MWYENVLAPAIGCGQAEGTWHDYTIGTLDVLQACDACADMGMTYSVSAVYRCSVQCSLYRSIQKQKMAFTGHVLRG